jgi:hypothetical protein
MESRKKTMIAGLVVLAAAVGLFVALRPGDSEDPRTAAAPAPANGAVSESAPDPVPAKPEPPKVPVIVVRGGEPVGGPMDIDVKQGDRIRFKVKSDVEEEVHVHGFDFTEDVGPGQNASFDFKADITGIYEAELEFSGVPIATLQINP